MQASNMFVVLVVVALFGLVYAAPAEELSGVEQIPAMLVRLGPAQLALDSAQPALDSPQARTCTNSYCVSLCRLYGWRTGYCLSADWCHCHN